MNNALIQKLQKDIERLEEQLPDLSSRVLLNEESIKSLATRESLSVSIKPLIAQMNSNSEKILENEQQLMERTSTLEKTVAYELDMEAVQKCAQEIINTELTETRDEIESQLTDLMNGMTEIEDELFTLKNNKKHSAIAVMKQHIMKLIDEIKLMLHN